MADMRCRHGFRYGTCHECGEWFENYKPTASDRIAALEAEVERLRRERDEARARLAKVGEAVGYAGNRWGEWGTRAETVGEMLDHALSGPVGEGVA